MVKNMKNKKKINKIVIEKQKLMCYTQIHE